MSSRERISVFRLVIYLPNIVALGTQVCNPRLYGHYRKNGNNQFFKPSLDVPKTLGNY